MTKDPIQIHISITIHALQCDVQCDGLFLCCWVVQHRIIWIVIGKVFTNQSFTENRAVINGKWYKYIDEHLSRDLLHQKLHPLRDAAFDADCLTPLRILKIITIVQKWILVMLSRIITYCKKFQILMCGLLQMKSLHLVLKFRGYILNGRKMNLKTAT